MSKQSDDFQTSINSLPTSNVLSDADRDFLVRAAQTGCEDATAALDEEATRLRYLAASATFETIRALKRDYVWRKRASAAGSRSASPASSSRQGQQPGKSAKSPKPKAASKPSRQSSSPRPARNPDGTRVRSGRSGSSAKRSAKPQRQPGKKYLP